MWPGHYSISPGSHIETVEAHGEGVVDAVLDKFRSTGYLRNETILTFLRRIAIVESKFGDDPNTFKDRVQDDDGVAKKYHGGIWQVDKIGFDATKDTGSHPSLNGKYEIIRQKFGIWWPDVTWSDLRKPLYSAIAARLYLSRVPQPIPSTLNDQAEYWKEHYNTSKGKGTKQGFIDKVNMEENMEENNMEELDNENYVQK